MITQGTYNGTSLEELREEFNRLIGVDKLMQGLFNRARSAGTNTAFNNSWTTVESVSLTVTINSIVYISGSCDARFNDSNIRSTQSRIVTNDGSGDVVQSNTPFQLIGVTTSAQLRNHIGVDAVAALSAGTYTLKFQAINQTDTNSLTTDNSQIIALAVPNR